MTPWLASDGWAGHFLGPKICLELELPPWSVLNWNAAAMSSRRTYSETNEPGWKPAKVIPVLSRFSGWSMQKPHWLIACTVIISAILGSTNPEPLSGKVGRGFGSANWDSRTRCRVGYCTAPDSPTEINMISSFPLTRLESNPNSCMDIS